MSVLLEDGRTIRAHEMVLALGGLAGGRRAGLPEHPDVHGSPWSVDALDAIDGTGDVVLIGAGLTAVDAALSIAERSPDVVLHMVSRSGALPFAHPQTGAPVPMSPPGIASDGPLELDDVVAAYRDRIAQAEADGDDWRGVVDSLRPMIPSIWARLGHDGRRRFIEQYARAWEIRRHRMAPAVARRLDALVQRGRLVVHAGGIAAVASTDSGLRVTLGDTAEHGDALRVRRIVQCTGPGTDVATSGGPLVRRLLDRGIAASDDLGLGLRADADARIIGANDAPHAHIRVIGPLRRGELWETTAVAEIRAQAAAIARSASLVVA